MAELTAPFIQLMNAAWPWLLLLLLFRIRRDLGRLMRGLGSFLEGAGTLMTRISKDKRSSALRSVERRVDRETRRLVDITPVRTRPGPKQRKAAAAPELPAPPKPKPRPPRRRDGQKKSERSR